MLNALRLVDGVPAALFTERTGQPLAAGGARRCSRRAIADCWRRSRRGCERPCSGDGS
ncbi:MAG: hypothetical protein MZV65_13230 [Chromatiales bacterium]|nr:hypothetical protein [Chromatiales bacterium]